MKSVLEQIEDFLTVSTDGEGFLGGIEHITVDLDEDLFDKMVDFIVSLKPEQLTDEQLEQVQEIIDMFEFEERTDEVRLLRKTTRTDRRKAKIYRRKNKAKIKRWRKKNKRKLKRARKTGRGLTGKRRGRTRRRPGGPR
jgi:glutamate synthase domain-containing protein 3